MGRWAQRRLRGGGVTPASTPLLSIASVTIDGAVTVTIQFDGPITYAGSGLSGFDINGIAVSTVDGVGTSSLDCTMEGLVNSGDTWSLNAQPGQITEVMVVPESGTTI